jgi:hypothetical protein
MIARSFAALAVAFACAGAAQAQTGPTIEIGDVARFYSVYDAAGGKPTGEQLQRDYLDAGSEGLKTFARLRNTTGVRIADAVAGKSQTYVDARKCAEVLPAARLRLDASLRTLARLYPPARFPPVTVAVGRGKPVGVGSPVTGVQIGLEALCATDFLNPDLEDRFVHVIAHEFVHVQQAPALTEKATPTVLEASLIEGGAEFVTELISGQVAYSHLPPLTAGREAQIETAFLADAGKTDLSAWLYNSAAGEPDLGYWVGYRIAKAYYQQAPDKPRALREIIETTDAQAFLAASGWRPGMTLD